MDRGFEKARRVEVAFGCPEKIKLALPYLRQWQFCWGFRDEEGPVPWQQPPLFHPHADRLEVDLETLQEDAAQEFVCCVVTLKLSHPDCIIQEFEVSKGM